MKLAQDGAEVAWIAPGSFIQGSDSDDWKLPGPNNHDVRAEARKYAVETPRRIVVLTRGFWLHTTPVTLGQWKRFAAATRRPLPAAPWFDRTWEKDTHPMVNVPWQEALVYARGIGGTLPTEAQWEYAARTLGKRQRYPWGDPFDEGRLWEGWHHGNEGTASVTRTHNRYISPQGLLDMAGNVWEWCWDWFAPYLPGPQEDPQGPAQGVHKVRRGGAFTSNCRLYDPFRCTYRGRGHGGEGDENGGFRVAFAQEALR